MRQKNIYEARFADRHAAGRELARQIHSRHCLQDSAIVLALPRGGVPVGYEVAIALQLLLDVMVVRKLGTPGHEEVAMGAIAGGGIRFLNKDVIAARQITPQTIDQVVEWEERELERRERLYRGERSRPDLRGRQVILVDDGLATGATMRVAIEAARRLGADHLIVAVPVAPLQVVEQLATLAEDVVCLQSPRQLFAVSLWYRSFGQTPDQEVQALLAEFWSEEKQIYKLVR